MSLGKSYSGKLKFQVVMELLQGNNSLGQIAKVYGIHPNTIVNWRKRFEKHGYEIFETKHQKDEEGKLIVDLEQLLGKKEVELALFKNFLGRSR